MKVVYDGANSRVGVNGCFSERFEVTFSVHQGSVLSPLLFVIVMEALSRECRIGCTWKFLYTGDLVMSNIVEDLKIQLQAWRTALDIRGLGINVGKTKTLDSSGEAQKPTRNVKWSCGVCSKGVGVNSILCQACNFWIHKRCSGVKRILKKESMFRCKKCKGESALSDSFSSTQALHMSVKTHSKLCQLFNTLMT